MLKKIVGVFICTLMISSVLVSATAQNDNTQAIGTQNGTILVKIPTGKLLVSKTAQGSDITIENYGRLLIPGKPNLPAKIFSIAIPPGAHVTAVNVETNKGVILPGLYRIAPCALPRVIGEENPTLYAQDQQRYTENYKTVYGSNSPYPVSIGDVMGTGGYRKYNLVDVRMTPFTYYPLSGVLIYYPDISVSVSYSFPAGFSTGDIMVDNLPQTEQIARETIVNYDQAQAWYPNNAPMRSAYDYVIITTDALTSSIDPLVSWESAKGHNVNVVTTSWISTNYQGYDLAAKMRAFLLDKYPSSAWGILDVCLVGSTTDVPMRLTAQNVGYGAPETDYYYAELSLPDSQSWDANGNHQYGENSDPIDFQNEITVGRIPWSDEDTVLSICEKTVAYEQNTEESFKKNILLLGAYFWPDTDNAVLMETKVDQSWMTDWTMTRMYEDAQSPYPCDYDLNYNNVKTVWSAGSYAFVDWAGHGSPDAAYEYYPSQPFVDETTCTYLNDEFPSIIFADSCSNSDTDYLNIGQAMLKQGGVGFLGSNKVAYGCPGWNNPMSGSSQSLDYFFTTCCTSYNYTLGQAHQYALHQMYTNNLWDYMRYEMFEWGSIFGNPDLTMGPVTTSEPPSTPQTPVGPTHGTRNIEYQYTTSSIDPNGDQIYYLFNWGDGTSSTWLGPYTSGMPITGTHAWTTIGTYEVKVKAKDINGATSGWSAPLIVSIVLNDPPDAPTITGPGEGKPGTIYLFVVQTTDPNDDTVSYFIDWGDNTTSDWIGPYASGAQATITHSWSEQGTFTVKVKAKDQPGDESDWGILQIVMPFELQGSQQSSNQLLEKLTERMIT
jgi:hypothetical protein